MHDTYLTSDTLAEDVERWGFETAVLADVPRPPRELWDRLPASLQASYYRFERALGDGTCPALPDFRVAPGEPEIGAPADEAYPLAVDADGDIWCLMARGDVMRWDAELGEFDESSGFASIDQLVWGLVRYQAAMDGKILYEAAISMFQAAHDETGIGWLRAMLQDELYAAPVAATPAQPSIDAPPATPDERAARLAALKSAIERADSMRGKATVRLVVSAAGALALMAVIAVVMLPLGGIQSLAGKVVVMLGLGPLLVAAITAMAKYNKLRAGHALERTMAEKDLSDLGSS